MKQYGLLNIPLLHQAFNDKNIRISTRHVDKDWKYEEVIPNSVSGFNPFHLQIYVAKKSSIADWIKAGKRNDRKFNESDFLVQEVLFVIHDYLHAWSCLLIQNLVPRLKFGYGKINEENFEDYVFCHLCTEAVATVGLDYWYLSTIDLNQSTGLGTNQNVLTVSYHEKNLSEFRRFNPNVNVQSKSFFEKIAAFYCTGEFKGFDIQDIKSSPILREWLSHELSYGSLQRKYTREWFSYLSNGKVRVSKDSLDKPFKVNKPWQKALMKKISEVLWNKVKLGIDISLKDLRKKSWSRKKEMEKDFRFTNLNSLSDKDLQKVINMNDLGNDFSYFFSQFISMYDFSKFPKEELKILSYIREKKDLKSLEHLFKKNKMTKVLKKSNHEPSDIFFLN